MGTDNSDFIAKLRQIEELASGVSNELAHAPLLLRTRVQHIVVLARTLRGRLEMGAATVMPGGPQAGAADEPRKPPA